MHIGRYLKERRELEGYTQEQLAELVGVTDRTIRRIENNPSPKVNSTYEKICKKLFILYKKSD